MNWTRRNIATVTTWAIVAAWLVFYSIVLATADPLPTPDVAVMWLVVPPVLLVIAARLALRHWWSAAASRTSATDPPQRLLAATVATLPERRRDWGAAMIAELAEIHGRSARWRFALSSARAIAWLPLAGRWPVLAPSTAIAVAAAATAGPAVGAAVPGLSVFAATFTGLIGAMAVLAVARSRRPRLPAPAPTILLIGAVAAAIAVTVIFLRREPAAAHYLPPAAAIYLATVLAGCLWLTLAPPRWLGTNRLAPHIGAAAATVFAAWFWLTIRTDGTEPPLPLVLVLGPIIVLIPLAAFFVPAFTAGRTSRSFRAGLKAALWTVTATIPLTYAVWLPEALRRHAIDGRSLDGEVFAPVGTNLTDALIFCLGIFPIIGLTLGTIGAAIGARPATPNDPT